MHVERWACKERRQRVYGHDHAHGFGSTPGEGLAYASWESIIWGMRMGKLSLVMMVVSAVVGYASEAPKPLADVVLPAGQQVTWGQEPVEVISPQRSTICLNGLWRFQPARGRSAGEALADNWGWLRVPGSWRSGPLPAVIRGRGPAWDGFTGDAPAGWYERDLAIPAAWAGRAVVLDLRRVSTDATVQIDGRDVGSVSWPGGEVDLTTAVQPGQMHRLRIKVVAVADQAEVTRFMGMGDGQQLTEKVVLATRGIVGDVLLTSRPRGAVLTGCGIRTTVTAAAPGAHGDQVLIDADYQGLAVAGDLALTAVVRDAAGAEVKRFTATVAATAGAGTVHAAWPWSDPQLWDIGSPTLYTLELGVRGTGIDDALRETFGFRELHVDGRKLILNGTEVRLRPSPVHVEQNIGGVRELIADAFDGMQWAGFNTIEPWPWNRDERGTFEFDDLWAAEADKRGFLVAMPAIDPAQFIGTWAKPGVADAWAVRMAPALKRLRNHPSVVAWVTGANRFGHAQDQNPQVIGQRDHAEVPNPNWRETLKAGKDIMRRIKEVDPSRPVFMHAGGPVGDLYTANNYLCLTALQEREEWLSRWATDGDMPVFMVEFGTPFFATFHRGRRGYGVAITSEPLYTEFAAIYEGAEAYGLESPAYRSALASTYDKGDLWTTWHKVDVARLHEGFNRLQALFQTNTLRTWRTFGVTGILPWGNGHAWQTFSNSDVAIPRMIDATDSLQPFVPGLRGAWRPVADHNLTHYLRPEGMPLTVAGKAQVAASKETLAWIGGAPDFVDKTHHVRAGATLAKQVVLINDGRTATTWNLSWQAELAGAVIAHGTTTGRLAPAEIGFTPLAVPIPATLSADRVAGVIRMTCTIGALTHTDAFPFTAFAPNTVKPTAGVAVLDPVGDTTRLLASLGITAAVWDGKPTTQLVVIGRNAFAGSDARPGADPAMLAGHLAAGGHVLLMAQDPEWLRHQLGLRVAHQVTRRAFPVLAGHPALAGLDAEALCDWAGESHLIPAIDAPFTDITRTPAFGWRWGTRHAISSAAVEIPHRAGWRPILACEFDGDYTPLAELAVGGGALTLCTLDLEDHAAADPAAEAIARAIIATAAITPVETRTAATYLGGDAGAAMLDVAGLVFVRAAALPTAGTVVIGPDALIADADLDAFLRRGGRAVVLPRATDKAPLGVAMTKVDRHPGSVAVPAWASCQGIWPGELHRRTDGVAWTITGGCDALGADGLLGEIRRGTGVAVFCQLDSGLLDADHLAYNRLTRWHWTRVLNQIAANLGVASVGDDRLLHPIPPPDRISLVGTWKATLTAPLPETTADQPHPHDPGPSPRALALVASDADVSGMQEVSVPATWESYGGAWLHADGEAVFRTEVAIPARWAGHELTLSLGAVDDFDVAYIDGHEIGRTTIATPLFWSHPRRYVIPPELATPGRHVIAVRVFDHFGTGGMVGDRDLLAVAPTVPLTPPVAPLYHPDYKSDFTYGDDPYRYYRW